MGNDRKFGLILFAAIAVTGAFGPGCNGRGTDEASNFALIDPNAPVNFQTVNAEIFTPLCSKCHSAWFGSEQTLLARGDIIEPGKALDSLIYQKIESGEMPQGGPKLSDQQIALVERYINSIESANVPAQTTPSPVPKAEATFSWLQTNLIQVSCAKCHSTAAVNGSTKPKKPPILDTIEGLKANANDAFNDVDTGDMPPAKAHMPAVTEEEKGALYEWIQDGYPE